MKVTIITLAYLQLFYEVPVCHFLLSLVFMLHTIVHVVVKVIPF